MNWWLYTWILKSPSMETLWDSSGRKSPPAEPRPSSIIWRSLRSRSEARAAKSNSEKKGPCNTVFTQCTAHSFDSCTSWYNIPPLLGASILSLFYGQALTLKKNQNPKICERFSFIWWSVEDDTRESERNLLFFSFFQICCVYLQFSFLFIH